MRWAFLLAVAIGASGCAGWPDYAYTQRQVDIAASYITELNYRNAIYNAHQYGHQPHYGYRPYAWQ